MVCKYPHHKSHWYSEGCIKCEKILEDCQESDETEEEEEDENEE
jgi:hypothetical protein